MQLRSVPKRCCKARVCIRQQMIPMRWVYGHVTNTCIAQIELQSVCCFAPPCLARCCQATQMSVRALSRVCIRRNSFPRAVLLATGPQAAASDIYAQIRSPQHVMPAVLPTRYALKRLVCFMHTICIISLAQLCAMVVRFTGVPFKRTFCVPTAS